MVNEKMIDVVQKKVTSYAKTAQDMQAMKNKMKANGKKVGSMERHMLNETKYDSAAQKNKASEDDMVTRNAAMKEQIEVWNARLENATQAEVAAKKAIAVAK